MKALFCIAAVLILCTTTHAQVSTHTRKVVHPGVAPVNTPAAREQPLPAFLVAPALTPIPRNTPQEFYNDATVKFVYAEAAKINTVTAPLSKKYGLLYQAKMAKTQGNAAGTAKADDAQLRVLVQQMSVYAKKMGDLSKQLKDKQALYLQLEAAKVK